MNTLAHELEDLEFRRREGTLTEADVAAAKEALLRRAARDAMASSPPDSQPAERLYRTLLITEVFSNLIFVVILLGGIAAAAYLLLPLGVALPVMIVCAVILPFIKLWDWVCDLFS